MSKQSIDTLISSLTASGKVEISDLQVLELSDCTNQKLKALADALVATSQNETVLTLICYPADAEQIDLQGILASLPNIKFSQVIPVSSSPAAAAIAPAPVTDTIITLDNMKADPVNSYRILRQRLDQKGMNAPFPEFKAVIDYIEQQLEAPSVKKYVAADESHRLQLRLLEMELFAVKVAVEVVDVDYPHKPPFQAPYPYLPTIIAVKKAVEFLDIVSRDGTPDAIPLYHTDRYSYHFNHIYDSPYVYFPTMEELNLDDLIRLRAAPIGLIGVSSTPVFADAYNNTPCDFFMHDINHIRRFRSYDDQYMRAHPELTPTQVQERFTAFIADVVLPSIEQTADMDETEKHQRQILKLFWFELLHEYAFTPDSKTLSDAFFHEPASKSPFEHMVDSQFDARDLEKLRLANNNLQSGCQFFKGQKGSEQPIIRYFFDKGPNFLTSAHNKLINGFYDTAQARSPELPPFEKRTPELMLEAATRLSVLLGVEGKIGENKLRQLLELSCDTSLEVYPTVASAGVSAGAGAT